MTRLVLLAIVVLVLYGRYGCGDHVSDPKAFLTRLTGMLNRAKGEHLRSDQ